MSCISIEPEVVVLPPEAVVLQDVQHSSHLAEDEDSRSLFLQLGQQLVQHTHLTTVEDKVGVSSEGGTWGGGGGGVCMMI